ncbi:hypothetical protein QP282_16110, partial [Escherichia coli]|nr:hypothetical protein [Escherichia coli]
MRPLILSIFALFLAGCTHSQQSMVDTFRASLFDNQDITVADQQIQAFGFAPIFPDICYHLTHYKPAAADIPV